VASQVQQKGFFSRDRGLLMRDLLRSSEIIEVIGFSACQWPELQLSE